MPKTPAWADEKPVHGPENVCGSWPHCERPPLEGGRFCAEHQAIMDRVGATLRPSAYRSKEKAPVVVTHVAPKPRVHRCEYRRRILAALAKRGQRNSTELASDCLTTVDDNTYRRARLDLLATGEVSDLGQSGRSGHLYELPA